MNKFDCLVIDDEKDLVDSIKEYFSVFGLNCDCAYNLVEAKYQLENNRYSIILLDLNLPDGNGYSLAKEIKAMSDLPIFFISACSGDDDIIRAYGIGADDYITKPFSLSVLYAKVKSKLLKNTKESGIKINKESMSAIVDGKEVEFKPMEFKLLTYFVDNAKVVLDKENIFNSVWQGIYNENTLNVHINKLRDKIEKNSQNPQRITTIWGVGYKYNDKA